jgi:hypothetical protein
MIFDKNEIIASAHPVKYHGIDYHDTYIIVEQNRTRRRIPNGYHFEDTGRHIYISPYYSHLFQHKKKPREFIVNKITKEWRSYDSVIIEHHLPAKIEPITPHLDESLTR